MDLILLTVNGFLGVLASALALSGELVRARHRAAAPTHVLPACDCVNRTRAAGADITAVR